ncbi:hypothetical protein [Pacificispira sp.]|uniref:hypothetical protein n=1 Tax=Pacificispira sp. TaxID=2888761 RepID=UPI003BAAEDBB
MGLLGLIFVLAGILLCGSGIGFIFGIPCILLGVLLWILAIIKGGVSALFSLGGGKKD